MPVIIPIVEGKGEMGAVPVLLRKMLGARYDIRIHDPFNAKSRNNIVKTGGLESLVQSAENELYKIERKKRNFGGMLVLLDTDKDCPKALATSLAARVSSKYPVAVVCANQDYEAWFLPFIDRIAGQDINGRVLLKAGLTFDGESEGTKGKGWIKPHVAGDDKYSEPEDQVALTRFIDIDNAALRAMRSFQRLRHAVEELITAIDTRQSPVTPKSQT